MFSVPEELWESRLTSDLLEELCFLDDLWPADGELFKLDGHFFSCLDVKAKVDFTK